MEESRLFHRLTTCAGQVVGQSDGHLKLLRLGLGEAVGTRNIVRDFQRNLTDETEAVACLVKIANIRAGAISVDLVDCNLDRASLGDLGNSIGGQSVFGILANVDITG